MKRHIRITAGSVTVLAELNDTRTADAICPQAVTSMSVETKYIGHSVKIELENGQ